MIDESAPYLSTKAYARFSVGRTPRGRQQRFLSAVAVLVISLVLADQPQRAHADAAYTAETIAVDAAGMLLLWVGGQWSDHAPTVGIVTTWLGTPTIHLIHGQSQWAAQSVALRVGGTLVIGLPLMFLFDADDDSSLGALGDTAGAWLLGATAAVVFTGTIDAVRAYRHGSSQRRTSARARTTPVAVPVSGGGVMLGIVAFF